MNEHEVLTKTHAFIKDQGLCRQSVMKLFTDAHSTLLKIDALKPFQRFTLEMGDMVLHPDLVGQLGDGESIFAVEAKGSSDLLKGIAQAEMYQFGFHYSFLAADASSLGSSLVEFARHKDIGLLAVGEAVKIIHLPEARMPLREAFQFIKRQLESVAQVTGAQTFQYNIPTHYLVWPIVLQPDVSYQIGDLIKLVAGYPIPDDGKAALRGAQKLGLVTISGKTVLLSDVGATVKIILPESVTEWASIHEKVKSRKENITLAECEPKSAAALRLLLLHDPIVRLIMNSLRLFPNRSANFADLAKKCDQLDRALAPIFFLKPESSAALMDDRGRTNWERAVGEDYRSTMFFQYKSILKHAGILMNAKLGGASAISYNPLEDIWSLR
ncbi:MAG: hypothetical protein AB1489_35030 [Acidobacteriota bacterium]